MIKPIKNNNCYCSKVLIKASQMQTLCNKNSIGARIASDLILNLPIAELKRLL